MYADTKMVIKGTAQQSEIQNIEKESIHMYTGMERFIEHFSHFCAFYAIDSNERQVSLHKR